MLCPTNSTETACHVRMLKTSKVRLERVKIADQWLLYREDTDCAGERCMAEHEFMNCWARGGIPVIHCGTFGPTRLLLDVAVAAPRESAGCWLGSAGLWWHGHIALQHLSRIRSPAASSMNQVKLSQDAGPWFLHLSLTRMTSWQWNCQCKCGEHSDRCPARQRAVAGWEIALDGSSQNFPCSPLQKLQYAPSSLLLAYWRKPSAADAFRPQSMEVLGNEELSLLRDHMSNGLPDNAHDKTYR